MKSRWLKHGFWNTTENGLTRVLDAASTLFLLWVLSPEKFSELAIAQAIVAPCLLFFISPETTLYRDYGDWEKQGPNALASRMFALRAFNWFKVVILFVLAWIISRTGPSFWVLVWAFSITLTPQIVGADREFIRINLELKTLNLLTSYQKISLFLGTGIVAFGFSSRFELLAIVSIVSLMTTAALGKSVSDRILKKKGATSAALAGEDGVPPLKTLADSFRSFSLWRHFLGVLQSWILTMDLFFLGVFAYPARGIGLYSTVVKICNFTQTIPFALSNLFAVWVSKRSQEDGNDREKQELKKLTGLVVFGNILQAVVLLLIVPWIFNLFSHGRWTPSEMNEMKKWLIWLMTGNMILSSSVLYGHWLLVRTSAMNLLLQVYVPWAILALGIYSGGIYYQGFSSAAVACVPVALIYVALLGLYYRRKVG